MNQSTIRTYMAIMAERDAAIRERNMALEERKRAFAERDMAVLQRDAALAECNSVIQERDEAIAALAKQESSLNEKTRTLDTTTQGKHNNIWQQMQQIKAAVSYTPRGDLISDNDTFNLSEVASETTKPWKARQPKESKLTRSAKFPRTGEIGAEESRRPAYPATSSVWGGNAPDLSNDDEYTRPIMWKDNSSVNEIKFDESVMPAPVCTCTGSPQPCYRWGNGGWQSACCTTRISMYPLPQVSNKRYTRVGGRKMSGSAFCKLLNRLASDGYNLSTPVDLKDHWAKHGTNRYATVK